VGEWKRESNWGGKTKSEVLLVMYRRQSLCRGESNLTYLTSTMAQ
jgi:hypothetical protein